MRNVLFVIIVGISSHFLSAQNVGEYDFFLQVPSTSLKDQQSSGTCWSFVTTSFIEAEAIRLGKDPVSISPIYYVHPTYINKAAMLRMF